MKSGLRAYVLLFVCLVGLACTKNDVMEDTPTPPDPPGNNSGLNEALLLQLVNQRRQQGCDCGTVYYPPVGTLSWNNQLETAANAHASDMNQHNYFSHTGRDGSSPGERITRAGYNWLAYGENIAKGYSNEQAVVTAWINSEGHCKNIMNANFGEMGAAKVGEYWVQEFGRR